MEPYEWEASNEEIARKVGLRPDQVLRFDTNSSPFSPDYLLERLSQLLSVVKINEYPDTSYASLTKKLSGYTGAGPEQITVTNGADEGLDIAAKTLIDEGTDVIIPVPTYSMYRIMAQILGANITTVTRRDDFSEDMDGIIKACGKKTSIIFLCNPNNPTGNRTRRESIERLLSQTTGTVVVDEAYYEFCGQTCVDLTKRHDNLVVVRTFSKAFSMAGARVGYLVASKSTTEMLNRVRPPNSLSVISLALAELALDNLSIMMDNVQEIRRERTRLVDTVSRIEGLEAIDTETNFFLTRFLRIPPNRAYEALLKEGIVSRDVSSVPLLKNCLRFTVRRRQDNDLLIAALKKVGG